ncbi:hypothetical protein [Pseudomonas caricapapayae]|uniref:hypothetical protein n=1 Tax=Pseudomonas caricapapayae TaxID=46678 RepID=UPI000EFFC102|nr:hypothetical protein [Pseudomonas caricapapayae]
MSHEEFARQRAADGWSQQNVADALGMSRYKLRLWLEGIAPIQWPKPWESKNAKAAVQRLNERRQGCYPEQFRRTYEKSRQTRRANLLTKAFGEVGTIAELATKNGVTVDAVRHRVRQGYRLEHALKCAKQAKIRFYTAFGKTATLPALVAEFGVVSCTAVTMRMCRGMTPEEALTTPPQHMVWAYRPRSSDHPWRKAETRGYRVFQDKKEARVRREQGAVS